MYRAPSKRVQLIKRIAVYSTMTLAVVLLVTFLVFVMQGYRFNRDTSQIEQGGLVQFASRPENANVTIGNANLGDLTPSKITVNPGNYKVSMNKRGYLPWKKNADVRSGQVLWLNYAQLVPEKISTKQLTQLPTVASVLSSPNGDRLAIIPDAAKPEITFIDINGEAPKVVTIQLPASVLPVDKTLSFSLNKWANDSDHLLVDMTYDGVTERLFVDRGDAKKTVNISTAFEKDIVEVLFDPRSSSRLIARSSNGDVRIVDISASSLSAVMATGVTSMSTYGNDALVVVRTIPGGQSVGYVSFGSQKVRELKRVSSTENVRATLGSYFSDPYFAIAIGNRLEVYKLRSLPSSESEASIGMSSISTSVMPATVDFLSIRSGGRFVFAQYAGGALMYDIELGKQSLISLTTPTTSEIRWLDRYHFYVTNGTHLEVIEFDGGNPHTITGLTTQFDAVQSDDGKYIYTVAATATGFALQRSQMILE